MDLTPKSSTSTPWWSLFDCCRPAWEAEEQDGNGSSDGEGGEASAVPSLKIATTPTDTGCKSIDDEVPPNTPATARTDSSADVSFDSEGVDNFIGEVTVSSPIANDGTSPVEKAVTFEDEGESNFIGNVAVFTPQNSNENLSPEKMAAAMDGDEEDSYTDDDDEMSHLDDSSDWHMETSTLDENQSRLKNIMKATRNMFGYSTQEDDTVPDINAYTMSTEYNLSATQEGPIEVKFYQFMGMMLLRHIFGFWLSEDWDPARKIFTPKKLLLTQYGSSSNGEEKREFRELSKVEFENINKKVEVVPQLKREDESESLDEMPIIAE